MVTLDCSLTIGTRLGPYEIVSFIAAGGMGEVYAARDTRLGRSVAIKILPEAYGSDRDRLARFEKEARSASQLAHPNIITVYDVGEQGDLPYIVSELLQGQTLAERLKQRSLTRREVIDVAISIARGLAAAHEKRIVHRDLKPANIFITDDGQVKILDFGLAKLTQQEWEGATSDETQSLISRPGVVVGTAAYMSPEQVQGAAADLRSDIFSLGSILYEMLTGRRAFHGQSPIETMTAILRDDPEPIEDADPPELVAVIDRCLAKRPDGRFASAGELLFALEQISTTSAAARSWLASRHWWSRSRWKRPITLAGAVMMAVLALIITSDSRSRVVAAKGEIVTLRLAKLERITNNGRSNDGHISGDGAFVSYETALREVYLPRLRHVPSGSEIDLLSTTTDRGFVPRGFSADGAFVYLGEFVRSGTGHPGAPLWDPVSLVRVPLLGGTPQPVKAGWLSSLRQAPNGTHAAYIRWAKDFSKSEIVVADPYLKTERVIATGGVRSMFIGNPTWSADSTRVVAAVNAWGPAANGQPIAVDITTGATHRIPLCEQIGNAAAIEAAHGGWIVQSGTTSQLWHVSDDGSRCSQLTDLSMTWILGDASRDGLSTVATGTQEVQNLWRITAGDKEPPVRLTQGINTMDGESGLALLGERIILARNATGKVGARMHLWILDRDGHLTQVTHGESSESGATPAPDGHTIAYLSLDDQKKQRMWVLDTSGGEPRELPFVGRPMSFSPDGTAVYCVQRDEKGGKHVKRVPVTGGEPEEITSSGLRCDGMNTSPDAKMLFCVSGETLTFFSTADWKVLRSLTVPPNARWVQWMKDSSGVTIVQHLLPEGNDVWRAAVRAGDFRRIAHVEGEQINNPYQWSADGRSFVCSRTTEISDVFLLQLEPTTPAH